MKAWKIVLISAWILLALLLVFALVFGLCGGYDGLIGSVKGGNSMAFRFGWGGSSWPTDFDGIVPSDGRGNADTNAVSAIKIEWLGGEVRVKSSDTNDITFEQTSGNEIPEDRKLAYSVENGVLHIREGGGQRIKSIHSTNLSLCIPASYVPGELSVSGVSANIGVTDVKCSGNIKISTVSGAVELESISASGAVSLSSTSGEIFAREATAVGGFSVSTTSGKVSIQHVDTDGDLDISSVSGQISSDVTRAAGKLVLGSVSGSLNSTAAAAETAEISSTSGSVNYSADTMPKDMSVSTVSGRVQLNLPQNSGFTLKHSTVSGSVTCAFPTITDRKKMIYGDGTAEIDVSTVSGSITITQLQ